MSKASNSASIPPDDSTSDGDEDSDGSSIHLRTNRASEATIDPATTSTMKTTKTTTAKTTTTTTTKMAGVIMVPGPKDVLFGRGKPYQGHPGNLRLHELTDACRERFIKERHEGRRQIVANTIAQIQNEGGRFLKRVDTAEAGGAKGSSQSCSSSASPRPLPVARDRGWEEVPDKMAKAKVSHILRGKPRKGLTASMNSQSTTDRSEQSQRSTRDQRNRAARVGVGTSSDTAGVMPAVAVPSAQHVGSSSDNASASREAGMLPSSQIPTNLSAIHESLLRGTPMSLNALGMDTGTVASTSARNPLLSMGPLGIPPGLNLLPLPTSSSTAASNIRHGGVGGVGQHNALALGFGLSPQALALTRFGPQLASQVAISAQQQQERHTQSQDSHPGQEIVDQIKQMRRVMPGTASASNVSAMQSSPSRSVQDESVSSPSTRPAEEGRSFQTLSVADPQGQANNTSLLRDVQRMNALQSMTGMSAVAHSRAVEALLLQRQQQQQQPSNLNPPARSLLDSQSLHEAAVEAAARELLCQRGNIDRLIQQRMQQQWQQQQQQQFIQESLLLQQHQGQHRQRLERQQPQLSRLSVQEILQLHRTGQRPHLPDDVASASPGARSSELASALGTGLSMASATAAGGARTDASTFQSSRRKTDRSSAVESATSSSSKSGRKR